MADGPDVLSLSLYFQPKSPPRFPFSFILKSAPFLSRLLLHVFISSQRINQSQEELYPPPGGPRPNERMQQHYQQDYQHRDMDNQHRDVDYQRGPPGGKKKDLGSVKMTKDETVAPDSVSTATLWSSLVVFST